MNKRTTKEYTLIILGAIGALSISPFALIRYWQADYAIAITDLCIGIGMSFTCIYVFHTGKVKIPSIFLALLSVSSVLASIYVKGISQVYWLYPAMIAAYYLLQPRLALYINLVVLIILLPILYPIVNHIGLSTILITALITNMFAYIFSYSADKQHQQLTLLATKDGLTSSGNRRALDNKLSELVLTQQRAPSCVSLILFDLDHFKKINDIHGHMIGDETLIKVVKLVEERLRCTDALFRYGGEEFVIVPLPIGVESAVEMAEQLRLLIEQNNFGPILDLTVSFGVAEYKANEPYESWLSRADKALYTAKAQGRNKVCFAE